MKNLNLRFLRFENTLDELEQLPDDFPTEGEVETFEKEEYERLAGKYGPVPPSA